jgi:GAF domain-containing protein
LRGKERPARRGTKPAKPKVEAKPPVARKSSKSDSAKLHDLEKRLAEALARETATSEILRVISQSPTAAQPVFEAIVRSGAALCHAPDVIILIADSGSLHIAASVGPVAASVRQSRLFQGGGPLLTRGSVSGRAVIDRRTVHVHDVSAMPEDEFPEGMVLQREYGGHGTTLSVPLLRDDVSLGAITLLRNEVRPFTDRQVALLETFADQAVIAIENARLFNETKEALEQQTATSEILKVIASSPTQTQPVFDAIVQNAARLCSVGDGFIVLAAGDALRAVSATGKVVAQVPDYNERRVPLSRESVAGRAIIDRATIHIADLAGESEAEYPEGLALQRILGHRTMLVTPLLREGDGIGAIVLSRFEVRLFSERQIELLKTFADQAVIAIENVRLFTELESRNRDLTTALDQQTATSEILRSISRSLTDVQPVFNTIVQSGLRLLGGYSATMMLLRDDDRLDLVAYTSTSAEADSSLVDAFPMPLRGIPPGERAIHERRAHAVEDVEIAPDVSDVMRETGRARGWRSNLFVPMIRDAAALGLISITRRESGPFAADQIALLEIFAAQAVIAIENVRLFKELEARNAELTEALAQQTATADILRSISASPTDYQPVFDTIVRNAGSVCGAVDTLLWTVDGDELVVRAHHGPIPGTIGSRQPVRGSVAGRAASEARVVHVEDLTEADDFPVGRDIARRLGWRTTLSVPLLREGAAAGAILIRRSDVRLFTPKEIALLQTFADQAVIAVENVRLFNETQEALEQQIATSEILGVISQSPNDVQPVFDTIAARAKRLCDARECAVFRFDGELIHLVAQADTDAAWANALRSAFPRPPGRGSITARAIQTRSLVHIPDVLIDPEFELTEAARASSVRSTLSVPMIREGEVIGAITVDRREPKPFLDKQIGLVKIFADQAVIAIENVRLFTELRDKNRALTEAHRQVTETLEQQTATGEILRVISSSPTDVQPVFDAVAGSAIRLCEAEQAVVVTFDGEVMHLAALAHFGPRGVEAMRQAFPLRPDRGSALGRAVLSKAVAHIPSLLQDPEYRQRDLAHVTGFRGGVAVPMLKDERVIGSIAVARLTPGPFSDRQIALLQTFADQAVIAVENVRLFKELEARNGDLTEALEQQTATAEILRVISSSPTDVQPIFDAIVRRASRLCGGEYAIVTRYDGKLLHLAAQHNPRPGTADETARLFPQLPLRDASVLGRALFDASVIHFSDVETEELKPSVREAYRRIRLRAVVAVPMVHEGRPIGVVSVSRGAPGPFSDRQIALLQTFADQAVIAIENVRLFTELQASNRELTTALDTQTATSDILRVISRSQTDVQPVFDTILASAVRLLRGYSGLVTRIAGDQIELAALTSTDDAGDAATRAVFPQSHQSDGPHAQAMRDQAPINIADAQTDPRVPEAVRTNARARGSRSWVIVPLLRYDEAVGTIAVTRREPGGFTDDEIALLKTFADQAVIAIENVRLLSELQARTQELTRSVEQLTALGDVGRAVSSSLDLDTVLTTIVGRAVQLSGTDGGTIFEYDEGTEEFSPRATLNADERQTALLRATRLRRGEGAVGQMAVTREPTQIPDIAAEGAYESRLRGALLEAGTRAVLAIPLLHEERIVGGLVVTRRTPGEFTGEVVEILKTFATQSALAIQNARLFHEIERKSRQLEAASQHKSEFLANMSHELRTPLNAVIGFSEVLTERMFGELNEKQDEYVRDINASGTHLLSLINDILDLSKIEAGRMELELADFHLPQAIDNALVLVRERALRRGITLEQSIDARLGEIRGDERNVKQVLLNLLSNAIKFTPEGGRVGVRAELVDEHVEVAVSDTGVGIAPEDHEAVFEEFRQVGTAEKKAEGTGLGLALARKFIELHGGRIWVKSQVGVGSTFTFTIPIGLAHEERA